MGAAPVTVVGAHQHEYAIGEDGQTYCHLCEERFVYVDGKLTTPQTETRVVNAVTGGAKGMKVSRFDLIPPDALWALAEHYGRGATKYADRNWELGTDYSLNFAAAQRHMWEWWAGSDEDAETGTSHLICAAWHMFALYHFQRTHPELDDRPK